MTKPHVYFATPSREWKVEAAFCDARTATLEHLTKLGWPYSRMIGPPGASGDVSIVRALLEEGFWRSKADYLFFLDGDLAWEAESVARVVRYDRPIVGAYYVPREHDWAAAHSAATRGLDVRTAAARMRPSLVMYPSADSPGQMEPRFELDGALVEAAYLGAGFLCIRRDTLAKMREHYKDEWQTFGGQRLHKLFEHLWIGETNDRCTEDVSFCRRWRAMGGTIWCDTRASFAHIGPCEYLSPSLASAFARKFSAPAAERGSRGT
jgi:hypothetical protein